MISRPTWKRYSFSLSLATSANDTFDLKPRQQSLMERERARMWRKRNDDRGRRRTTWNDTLLLFSPILVPKKVMKQRNRSQNSKRGCGVRSEGKGWESDEERRVSFEG